jgi:anaerobic ribonucleoside-triphosphate reductase activating protein
MSVRKISVAATRERSMREGPGIRYVIWVQGCSLKCKGCFNPHFWSQHGGSIKDVDSLLQDVIAARIKFPEIEGVTFLGGEPFEQAESLAELSKKLHKQNFSIMVFSGYTLAELKDRRSSEYETRLNFLSSIDLLVDGRYQQDNVDIDRPWVGSKNQEFHFLTERYSEETLFESVNDGLEITVLKSGEVLINGWVTDSQLENLLEKL